MPNQRDDARQRLQEARNNRLQQEDARQVVNPRYLAQRAQTAYSIFRAGETGGPTTSVYSPYNWNSRGYTYGRTQTRGAAAAPAVNISQTATIDEHWDLPDLPHTGEESPQHVHRDVIDQNAEDVQVWTFSDDDFDLTLIGESISESLMSYLDFVLAGNIDLSDDTAVTRQIRRMFEQEGVRFIAHERFRVTYDPTDADYKLTAETVAILQQNYVGTHGLVGIGEESFELPYVPTLETPNSFVDEEQLAYALMEYIEAEAQRRDLYLQNVTPDANAKAMLMAYVEAMWLEYGQSSNAELLIELDRAERLLQTFAPSLDDDVVEWAETNLGFSATNTGVMDIQAAIRSEEAESAIRSQLMNDMDLYDIHQQGIDFDAMGLVDLTEYYFLTQLDTHHESALSLSGLTPDGSTHYPLASASVIPTNPDLNPEAQAEILRLQGELSRVEFDLNSKLGLFEAFEGSYDPGPPPMVTLLTMAAGILIEPVDWVMTGIEVYQDIRDQRWENVAINLALAASPLLTGQMDNVLQSGRMVLNDLLYPDQRLYAFHPSMRPLLVNAADEPLSGARGLPQLPSDDAYNPLTYVPYGTTREATQRAIRSNARTLNQSLTSAYSIDPERWGFRLPEATEQAHHIVPSANAATEVSVQILINSGVGLNSAYNGVGLRPDVHALTYAGQNGTDYRNAINEAFSRTTDEATNSANREAVINLLDAIAVRLDDLQAYSNDELLHHWTIFIDDLNEGRIP